MTDTTRTFKSLQSISWLLSNHWNSVQPCHLSHLYHFLKFPCQPLHYHVREQELSTRPSFDRRDFRTFTAWHSLQVINVSPAVLVIYSDWLLWLFHFPCTNLLGWFLADIFSTHHPADQCFQITFRLPFQNKDQVAR